MHLIRYSYFIVFTIGGWLFFATIYAAAQTSQAYPTPQDNDATYSLPKYTPSHSGRVNSPKIQFNDNPDNDALYSTPVKIPPKQVPKKQATTASKPSQQSAPSIYVAPVEPNPAPLAPKEYINPQINPQQFYERYEPQPTPPSDYVPQNQEILEESYPFYYY